MADDEQGEPELISSDTACLAIKQFLKEQSANTGQPTSAFVAQSPEDENDDHHNQVPSIDVREGGSVTRAFCVRACARQCVNVRLSVSLRVSGSLSGLCVCVCVCVHARALTCWCMCASPHTWRCKKWC